VLIFFYKNVLKIILSFVVGRSKLHFFVRKILNSTVVIIVVIILGLRE